MNNILGQILRMALKTFVGSSLRRLKIHALIYYLETVRTARKAMLVFGASILCLVLMAGGALLIPIGLCMFMPWQPETKAWVVTGFGVLYLVAPVVVLLVLMSEKRWMSITRADKLMKDVLNDC